MSFAGPYCTYCVTHKCNFFCLPWFKVLTRSNFFKCHIDDDKIAHTPLPTSTNFVLFTLVQGFNLVEIFFKYCIDDDKIAHNMFPQAQILFVNPVEKVNVQTNIKSHILRLRQVTEIATQSQNSGLKFQHIIDTKMQNFS